MTLKTASRLPILFVLTLLALAACTPKSTATPTATSEVTPTAASTPTPTPAPAAAWLVAPAGVDSALQESVAAFLAERAPVDGFSLEIVESFDQGSLPPDLPIAIFLSPQIDVAALAAALPDTQFLVIGNTDLAPAVNLSVISAGKNQAVFLAGYLATLNAPDFRSGALLVDGAADTAQLQDSFLNGGRYFCGRCAPVYAPIVLFPLVGLVPAGADAAAWQAAFDALNQNVIETLYLPAEGLQPQFLAYLAEKGVTVVSDAPPPAGSESLWMATVQADALEALQGLWPALTAGEGGQAAQAGLLLASVNSANLSLGRQQLAERIIPDLVSGVISPLSVP